MQFCENRRMGKESSPAKVGPTPSVRFLEKHTYSQPSAKQLLDGERLQPTPGVRPAPDLISSCYALVLANRKEMALSCQPQAVQAHEMLAAPGVKAARMLSGL